MGSGHVGDNEGPPSRLRENCPPPSADAFSGLGEVRAIGVHCK